MIKTFIWRDFCSGYEDRGVLCINATDLEAARKAFWNTYEKQFEEWWLWYKENGHAGRRRKDVAWKDWKKRVSYCLDKDPETTINGAGVYYSGDAMDSTTVYAEL